jgi:RNA polymerase sigma-70 factor (ECF subfamily)
MKASKMQMSRTVANHRLLQRIHKLEEDALAELFDTYYRSIYRYIYHYVENVETAEDLTSEVFTRLLEKLKVGSSPKGNIKPWLYRVAHNICIDHARRQMHRNHKPLNEEMHLSEQDVTAQVHQKLVYQQARSAINRLTEKQRAVIILKYIEGLKNEEIALILDLSVGAVKALQHRGLASIRRYLRYKGSANEGNK